MDMSSGEWLSNLGSLDPETTIQHCHMMMNSILNDDEFDDIFQPTDFFFDCTDNSTLIDQGNNSNNISSLGTKQHTIENTHAAKEIKNDKNIGWSSCTSSNSSSERLISFGTSECDIDMNIIRPKEEMVHYLGSTNNAVVRNNSQNKGIQRFGSTSLCAQEHVLAERKRREKMTQRFLALSALIPGLKKLDKASILSSAAKYVKQLEEQVKLLEDQTTRRTVESAVLVKKMQDVNIDNQNSSSNEDYDKALSPDLLEIESRVSNKNVLIRIHSLKQDGLVQVVLQEIEKLRLTTLNCNVMPFGSFSVDITIIAQMDDDVGMTANDLVKHLGLGLQRLHNSQIYC